MVANVVDEVVAEASVVAKVLRTPKSVVAVVGRDVEVIIQRPLLITADPPPAVNGAAWVTVMLQVPLVLVGLLVVPTAEARVRV